MKGLIFNDCVFNDGKIYFFDGENGLPGQIEVSSGQMNFLNNISNYRVDMYDLALCHENKIIAASISGRELMCFDLEQKKCEYFNINCDITPWDNFVSICEWGTEVYIFPRNKREVLAFSLIDKSLKQIVYDKKIEKDFYCGCKINEEMWLFPKNGKEIVSFDMKNKTFEQYHSNIEIIDSAHAAYARGKIYILSRYGCIYIWDIKKEELKLWDIAEESHENKNTYCRLVFANEKLIMLPSLGEKIKIIDLEKQTIEIFHQYPDDFKYAARKWSKYYGFCEDEQNIYLAMRSANYILKIEKISGNIDWLSPIIQNRNEVPGILLLYSSEVILEKQLNVLEYVKLTKKTKAEVYDKREIIAKKIWRTLMC